jgi:hypothetical protein
MLTDVPESRALVLPAHAVAPERMSESDEDRGLVRSTFDTWM